MPNYHQKFNNPLILVITVVQLFYLFHCPKLGYYITKIEFVNNTPYDAFNH